MGVVLGVDIGGSATKIVGLSSINEPVGELIVKATDQITSMYGAIGHFSQKFNVPLMNVEKILLTGVGATFFDEDIYGISTDKVDEFIAIGYGGLYLAALPEAFVVSMGTGTAFVRATANGMTHIGGSGVGGGTLLGLSSLMLNRGDINSVQTLAENGNTKNVDLLVKDIVAYNIPLLPANLTASNFGNVKGTASEADIAAGILNMIFQTIGMLSVFASNNDRIKTFILTGTLTEFPQAKEIFDEIGSIHGIDFIIPNNAVFATAIGAAVSYISATL